MLVMQKYKFSFLRAPCVMVAMFHGESTNYRANNIQRCAGIPMCVHRCFILDSLKSSMHAYAVMFKQNAFAAFHILRSNRWKTSPWNHIRKINAQINSSVQRVSRDSKVKKWKYIKQNEWKKTGTTTSTTTNEKEINVESRALTQEHRETIE